VSLGQGNLVPVNLEFLVMRSYLMAVHIRSVLADPAAKPLRLRTERINGVRST
jgi:hypothetical protein